MKNVSFLMFSWLLLATVQCTAPYTPDRFPAHRLRFGSGGGFSGEVITWTLLPNGQLFRNSRLKDTTIEWTAHARREGRRLFQEAQTLELWKKPPFSHPGNVYRFIEWKDDQRTHRITWGAREYPVDSTIETLYLRLMALTRE